MSKIPKNKAIIVAATEGWRLFHEKTKWTIIDSACKCFLPEDEARLNAIKSGGKVGFKGIERHDIADALCECLDIMGISYSISYRLDNDGEPCFIVISSSSATIYQTEELAKRFGVLYAD